MKRKKTRFRIKFFLSFLCVVLLLPILPSNAEECPLAWTKVIQYPCSGGAYPEWSATYWAYVFNNLNKNRMQVFEGKFPYARYMSFVLYDGTTGNVLGTLLDKDIVPDDGSENPFVPGVERDIDREQRNYTVKVVQQYSINDGGPNVLSIPAGVDNAILLMRVYLPDPPWGDRGGVKLPTVTAYLDDASMTETTCPGILLSVLNSLQSDAIPQVIEEEKFLQDRIVFYRHHPVQGQGLYANGNNSYLIAPLINMPAREGSEDQLALVRFRAPTFPPTYSGNVASFSGNEDVRYWSVCLVDVSDTSTSRCIYDEKAVLDADGYFNLVIGSDELFDEKPVAGWNYLPWGCHSRPGVMIRQLIPRSDFQGDYAQAEETFLQYDPLYPESEDQNATDMTVEEFRNYSIELVDRNDTVLGDYNPKGVYCSEQAFRDGLCVIQ